MSLIGKLLVRLGLDNSEYKRGLEESQSQTKSFTGKIAGIFGKLGGIAAVGVVIKKAFDFGREAYNAAVQTRGVKAAFDKLNQPGLLNELKKATGNTVDELKLMQSVMQAKNFKIPLDQMATYLRFATVRAQETGQSVDYLVNSIIMGIGRRSPLILDNLGISAASLREELAKGGDYAEAVGRIIQKEMGAANSTLNESATITQQNTAAWEDAKSALGDSSFIRNLGDAFTRASTAVANFITKIFGSTEAVGANTKAVLDESKEVGLLITKLSGANTKESERRAILDRLKAINPDIVAGLNAENLSLIQLQKNARAYNNEIVTRLSLAGMEDKIAKVAGNFGDITSEIVMLNSEVDSSINNLKNLLQQGEKAQILTKSSVTVLSDQEKAKIIQGLSDIQTSGDDTIEKISQLKKLFGVEWVSAVSVKGFDSSFLEGVSSKLATLSVKSVGAQTELLSVQYQYEQTRKAIGEKLKDTTISPEEQKELTTIKDTIDGIVAGEKELTKLRKISQADTGNAAKLQAVKDQEAALNQLKDDYATFTGQTWGAKVTVSADTKPAETAVEGSIAFIENKISNLEIGFKLATTDEDRTKIAEQIKVEKQNLEKKTKPFEIPVKVDFAFGSNDYYEAEIKKIEDTINKGNFNLFGADLNPVIFDLLEKRIAQLRAEQEKLPQNIFPVGSVAAYDKEIKALTDKLPKLTGAEREAADELLRYYQIQRDGAAVDWKTDTQLREEAIKRYTELLKNATGAEAAYYQNLLNNLDGTQAKIEAINSTIDSSIKSMIEGLGTSLASGNIGAGLQQAILIPMAETGMAIGRQMVAFGGVGEALQGLMNNPKLAIPAGIALMVASAALKAGIQSSISRARGGSGGGSYNTFTGGSGYSNDGAMKYANAVQPAYTTEGGELVTRVSGSDLEFVLKKEQQKRNY